jgi:hypothetical protein
MHARVMQNFAAFPEDRRRGWSTILQVDQCRFARQNDQQVIIGLTVLQYCFTVAGLEKLAMRLDFRPCEIRKAGQLVLRLRCNATQNPPPNPQAALN